MVIMLVSPAGHVPLKSTETPAVKKKHRRTRSGVRSHDVSADAGNHSRYFCISVIAADHKYYQLRLA